MEATMEKIPAGIMSAEAERYFGVLLERIEGKFDALMEGFSTLEVAIKRLEARVDRLEERMDRMEMHLVALNHKVKSIEEELVEIRAELKLCVRRDEFQVLEKRVTAIERVITQ